MGIQAVSTQEIAMSAVTNSQSPNSIQMNPRVAKLRGLSDCHATCNGTLGDQAARVGKTSTATSISVPPQPR
jgi:hypothetical protein